MSSYAAEVGPGASFAGVDQGIDFTGKANVFALADGVVTRVVRAGSGWAGQGALLVYRVLSGPAKGRYVYVAEDFDIAPSLTVGSKVTQGQTIGFATGSGQAPGIETGWADSAGHAFGSPFPRHPTTFGMNFDAFVRSLTEGKPPAAAPAGNGDGTDTPTGGADAGKPKYTLNPDGSVTVTNPDGTTTTTPMGSDALPEGTTYSGLFGGLEKWSQDVAAKGLAYIVLTFLGIALVLFGLLDALGYSPKRVVNAVTPAPAGEGIPF